LFALCETTVEIASPQRGALGALTAAALTQLEAENAELNKRLNRPLGSLITPELKRLDNRRDSTIREIKRNVKAASKSSDPLQNAAGKIGLHFLTPFWNIEKQALNTETDLIGELLGRYNDDPDLTAAAATIGIAALWDELGITNTAFGMCYHERIVEVAAKEDSASKLRNNVIKSYGNFCTLLAQAVNLTPSDTLNTLFKQLDNLRKTYQELVPKKKAAEKKG
jgi:hypothetical protein